MQIEIGYPKRGATFADMEARFNQLPFALRADAYGKAVYDGAKDVAAQAIATAPVWAGRAPRKTPAWRYAANIFAVKVRRYRNALPRAYAWARAYHANWVEWGSPRWRKAKGGYHTMERAGEAMAPRCERHFERRIRNALRTVARQLNTGKVSRTVGRALATFADRGD